ncbi:MAG: winged helix-turn-helix transcriptional regulator [bacterium]|nr:winged helix-turn-helix transcriptional regulator [bacterium]
MDDHLCLRRCLVDDDCCQVFLALGDRSRLRILELLREGELCVCEICEHFEMTQPSVSHHLDILKRAGLVTRDKRGRQVYYRFNGDAIITCCCKQMRLLDIDLKRC